MRNTKMAVCECDECGRPFRREVLPDDPAPGWGWCPRCHAVYSTHNTRVIHGRAWTAVRRALRQAQHALWRVSHLRYVRYRRNLCRLRAERLGMYLD